MELLTMLGLTAVGATSAILAKTLKNSKKIKDIEDKSGRTPRKQFPNDEKEKEIDKIIQEVNR